MREFLKVLGAAAAVLAIYFGYQAANGHARIAVSHDKGLTWINDRDVGAQLGVQNPSFPEVVAGDGDRAAFAFFGTTTGGTDYDQAGFAYADAQMDPAGHRNSQNGHHARER